MEKTDIHLYDIVRILQGEVPLVFYVELIIRAATVYLMIIAGFRLMGKRMAKRLTRNELAAVSTLAAAVGIPLQTPDRGLIPGILIVGIVILVQRGVAYLTTRNESFERATQGRISTLVKEGVLQVPEMNKCHISRERVLSQLRGSEIKHLGEVERLYLEASGSFTIINKPKAIPGLCILPEWDTEFIREQHKTSGQTVCGHCGLTPPTYRQLCPQCGKENWVEPIL